MSPGVQRRVDEHPNGPLFERDPTELATAFGLDRDHEAQIVSLVVRCDLPATGRRDRDERHHASVFMAGQEHGIRMSDSHSRRVTVEPLSRNDELRLHFFAPVETTTPEHQLCRKNRTILVLTLYRPLPANFQTVQRSSLPYQKRAVGTLDGYGAGGTNGGLGARVVRH